MWCVDEATLAIRDVFSVTAGSLVADDDEDAVEEPPPPFAEEGEITFF